MSAFVLKLLAAACMLIDHAGLLLFPSQTWMRAVGRLAFPLFAYFIGEGFYYTKNRLRYFLRIFLLGVACQIPYAVVGYSFELGILITFSLSLCLMELLSRAKAGFSAGKDGLVWFIALCINYSYPALWSTQTLCLLALPLLLLYNGKPGKYRMKWFFYIFYPAHLGILWVIDWLMTRFF